MTPEVALSFFVLTAWSCLSAWMLWVLSGAVRQLQQAEMDRLLKKISES